ncbi:MAG: SpoIIE family protein phosphatase [Planctomycetaceae bacterium]|nr:SpoIIE family protein phosphatase [Planctomycetaceae bacterium]MBT6154403.1 SpoIIE family protein phosphatase [Planctomycetaceae bacterium]MBT6484066.1 SpoIIE family protein phosphatase [Planctomycetaceae bacterium]MBT6496865.1 SpoIIE family protein phosphatase [Planctomycetaceae bacterium]
MAFLKVDKGSIPGQILELHGERMVLGRHPSCHIVLDNAAVSRQHAQILESHGQFYIEDLRSRNATMINGKPIAGRSELHDCDRISVCDVQFSFFLYAPVENIPESPKPAAATAPPDSPNPNADTQTQTPALPPAKDTPEGDDIAADESSIISTLNASSASSLRLDIKPEAKLRAILGISKALGNTLDLGEILDKILDGLFRIFPQADEGFILLKDEERNKLLVKATKVRRQEDETSVRISMTIVKQAMQDREAILSADAVKDSRFKLSDSLTQLQIRSMMCLPLLDQNEKALGVIQLDTKDIRRQFSQNDLDLMVSVASQASLAVDNARLHAELVTKRDLQRDLDFATQVQLGFLPTHPPEVSGYDFSDFYEAALGVGGDYFDYIVLPDGRVAISLGDVAGKGVPAALLMARLFSTSRLHLLTAPNVAEAMTRLNAEIVSSGVGHRFVTCVMMVLDPRTHALTVANAGHMAPILRNGSQQVSEIGADVSGMPLGIVSDQQFKQYQMQMKPEDSLVLFTDGISEGMNYANEIYGTERLASYVATGPQNMKSLVSGIVEDVETFCDGRPQRDDMCLVALQRTE